MPDDEIDDMPVPIGIWVYIAIRLVLKLVFWIIAIKFWWWFAGASWEWFVPLFFMFAAVWYMLRYFVRCIWRYMKTEWGWTVFPKGHPF